jgi:hypothetical protein
LFFGFHERVMPPRPQLSERETQELRIQMTGGRALRCSAWLGRRVVI